MENKFVEFLHRKHLEYSMSQGQQMTAKEFAMWLGVPPTSYSNWINSNTIPSMSYLDRLAGKLGPGVYEAAGFVRLTESLQFNNLPTVVQHQLSEFVAELSLALSGIDPESPEAMEITRSVMDRFGFIGKENS